MSGVCVLCALAYSGCVVAFIKVGEQGWAWLACLLAIVCVGAAVVSEHEEQLKRRRGF